MGTIDLETKYDIRDQTRFESKVLDLNEDMKRVAQLLDELIVKTLPALTRSIDKSIGDTRVVAWTALVLAGAVFVMVMFR